MAPQLEKLIGLWTCKLCAGVGTLTSSTTHTMIGREFVRVDTRECENCSGSGISANAARKLGLLDA